MKVLTWRLYWFRILVVWLFMVCITEDQYAQVESIVLLTQRLESAPEDSSKVNILNRIASRHLDLNQLDQGMRRANEALTLADRLKYTAGRAASYENLGLHAYYSNRFRSAIDFYVASLHIFQYLDDSLHMARLLNEIGMVYRNLMSYDTALINFNRSKLILTTIRDSAALSETYNRIGLVYETRGEYEQSLENFMTSIQICQSTGNDACMSMAYCYMGQVYRKLSDQVRAGEYLEKALELNKMAGSTRGMVEIYLQLGIYHQTNERHQKAIEMFKKSLNLARYYNNQRKIAQCLCNIGAVYHDLHKYETALGFYERALKIQQEIGVNPGLVLTSTFIAGAYLDMIEARRSGSFNDFNVTIDTESEIFSLLDSSILIAKESGNFNDLVVTYETLIRASSIFRKYDEAVYYQNQLIRYKDSVTGITRKNSIAELQAGFDSEQKELEIALLNSNSRVQQSVMERQRVERLFYLGGGISLVLLIIGLYNRLKFVNRARNELQQKNVLIEEEKQRAEQSENVREQFLAKMSHEIRIPMNTIMGSVNILLNGEHFKSQIKYLNAIFQSSENLMVIIDDILDLTKLEAGNVKLEKEPFQIRKEIGNVKQILKHKASEKGIVLSSHINKDVPLFLLGDSTRLSQVLINLAGNGIKFTDKGKVAIDVGVGLVNETMVLLKISVIDTGIGIPQDRLDKIFRSFTQADADTNRRYGGTGLGLTISKQLLELQGGKIYVSSEPGKGSTFSIEIPYEQVHENLNEKKGEGSKSIDVLEGLKVLVVEDDEFNGLVLKDTLSASIVNSIVEVAVDGESALRKWASGNFDIILMDIELPEKNGHEVTCEIRAADHPASTVPIIAMTANAMQKEVEACYESGMNDFVAKPFDPEELILKIHSNLMNKKNNVNHV